MSDTAKHPLPRRRTIQKVYPGENRYFTDESAGLLYVHWCTHTERKKRMCIGWSNTSGGHHKEYVERSGGRLVEHRAYRRPADIPPQGHYGPDGVAVLMHHGPYAQMAEGAVAPGGEYDIA